MTLITVRPIRSDEIDVFAAAGNDSRHGHEVKQYLEEMLAKGSVRLEWCFLLEEAGQLRGRVAFWTLPKSEKPLAMVLLELPWDSEQYLSLGAGLLQKTLPAMHALGSDEIGYVLDAPVSWPQWQAYPEQRMRLLEQTGFRLQRETYRFEMQAQDASVSLPEGLLFRSLSEVGDAAFIEAIMRVSEHSLDSRIQAGREQDGAEAEARATLSDLQQMEYDSAWWQLAYTLDGELVGLVMPAVAPTFATIGYIGVVPEQRGRGYIDKLLQQGTATLAQAGAALIRADTDIHNIPMANAFKRAGYRQFATRRDYGMKLGDRL